MDMDHPAEASTETMAPSDTQPDTKDVQDMVSNMLTSPADIFTEYFYSRPLFRLPTRYETVELFGGADVPE